MKPKNKCPECEGRGYKDFGLGIGFKIPCLACKGSGYSEVKR